MILPKVVRDSHAWPPGTEFLVEETAEGILLRPRSRFPVTTLAEVVGCLKYKGKPKTIEQMRRGVKKQVGKRRDSGRY